MKDAAPIVMFALGVGIGMITGLFIGIALTDTKWKQAVTNGNITITTSITTNRNAYIVENK